MRWGSEEELRGGEALDNLHGSAAERTSPEWMDSAVGEMVSAAG
jgi:hypothetical protein